MKPKKKDIKKWCAALRSGKYQQGKGQLQTKDGYCCLGVACDVFIPENKRDEIFGLITGDTPEDQDLAPAWLKKIEENFNDLAEEWISEMNDIGVYLDGVRLAPFTFDEIADVLEAVYIHEVLG